MAFAFAPLPDFYHNPYTPLVEDGLWGDMTVSAMQTYLQALDYYPSSARIDGIVGYYTARAMQLFLRDYGYYPAHLYVIDGDDGPATWRSWRNFASDYKGSWISLPYRGWTPYNWGKFDGSGNWIVFEHSVILWMQRWLNATG